MPYIFLSLELDLVCVCVYVFLCLLFCISKPPFSVVNIVLILIFSILNQWRNICCSKKIILFLLQLAIGELNCLHIVVSCFLVIQTYKHFFFITHISSCKVQIWSLVYLCNLRYSKRTIGKIDDPGINRKGWSMWLGG